MKNPTSIDFARQVLQLNHVPVHFFTLPCDSFECLNLGPTELIGNLDDALSATNKWFTSFSPQKLYYVTNTFQCNYAVLKIPDSEEIMIAGPVLFEEIHATRFDQICEKIKIPQELHNYLHDYYDHTFFFPQTLFASIFTILANHLFGENKYEIVYTDFGEMDEWYQSYSHFFRIPDKPLLSVQMIEARYETENSLLSAVSNGNEAKAMDIYSKRTSHFIPQRLANELRDQKDYCIALNTLMRKSAEQAGVHPIHIDSYSNRNVQLIEQLANIEQCNSFRQRMIRGYCKLVREHNLKDYSLLTQKVITYVDTDLCADLSLKALSERLSVNASYLSTLFKKEMGMPLTDFVNHRRIQYAQKLLVSTEMPLKTIARQCGIPDVYYFSRVFKRVTGTTPKAYRSNTSSYEQFQEAITTNSSSGQTP